VAVVSRYTPPTIESHFATQRALALVIWAKVANWVPAYSAAVGSSAARDAGIFPELASA
jgi:hypothetical protein